MIGSMTDLEHDWAIGSVTGLEQYCVIGSVTGLEHDWAIGSVTGLEQ